MAVPRHIVKQLREGTYVPSPIGKKAREIATKDREKRIQEINRRKRMMAGDRGKYKLAGSNRATRRHQDGRVRTISELIELDRTLRKHRTIDDFMNDNISEDVRDGGFYH